MTMVTIEQMREKFGDEQTEAYVKYMKAMRALITVTETFHFSAEGSEEERQSREVLQSMLQSLTGDPVKMEEMFEGLLTLVIHMKIGGTFDEWFEGLV